MAKKENFIIKKLLLLGSYLWKIHLNYYDTPFNHLCYIDITDLTDSKLKFGISISARSIKKKKFLSARPIYQPDISSK